MSNTAFALSPAQVQADVQAALAEDLGEKKQDWTAGLIGAQVRSKAWILAREDAVICGRPWVEETLRQIAPSVSLNWKVAEGERCRENQIVVEFDGLARELLTAERTMLNFMQLLSATATVTARYVDAISAVPGNRARIVDTRKTIPGLRVAQKYAVHTGGGLNHRMGLFDAILIKENHIMAAGGVAQVLAQAAAFAHELQFIEIEVETLAQLQEALDAGANMVLLDNMPAATLREAVSMNAGRAILEVSGGVSLETVAALAATGVDRISIGAITKDVKAVDFSLRFDQSFAQQKSGA
jgi:nicotinate-nucleotide pyrophosphorylase (carboxylating)